MALIYAPKAGDIVMCDFPFCFAPPEMVKDRPVVVISPNSRNRLGLATVIPLSTTEPVPAQAHHVRIPGKLMPPSFQAKSTDCWAKCDMVYTLSTARLRLVRGAKNRATGKRSYELAKLDLPHLVAVRLGVAAAMMITGNMFTPEPDPAAVALAELAAAGASSTPDGEASSTPCAAPGGS